MPLLKAGSSDAAAAIWRWQEQETDRPAGPSPSRQRLVGSVQALVAGVVGTLIVLFWSRIVGTIVLALAGTVLFSAMVSPGGLYAGIQGVFEALSRLTGRALTWILLVPLFYLFFLPFGILLRRGRRDRLKRFFEPDAETYWEPHASGTRSASHERQY